MSKSGELANIAPPYLLPLTQRVKVKGIEFDEEFVAELISKYFINKDQSNEPRLSDALQIYIAESTAGDGRKFRGDALNSFRKFVNLIGDLRLSELRHIHICQFRDYLFATGLTPVTVRKQTAIMSAMLIALIFIYTKISCFFVPTIIIVRKIIRKFRTSSAMTLGK